MLEPHGRLDFDRRRLALSARGFIPRQRVAPTMGARGLTATWTATGELAVVSLRGAVATDNIDVMVSAIDAALTADIRALILDGDEVESWSIRGLEVAVLAATRAAESRAGFAMSGLRPLQLHMIHRQWPGVSIHQFEFCTVDEARTALTAASI